MCDAARVKVIAALAVLVAVAGCGPRSKHDLLARAERVTTKTELERALGEPDERDKLGPLEVWTYRASDGRVTFLITGESVALQATGESETEPPR